MKKLLSTLLALTLILTAFSALAPTAHAAGETISEEEAKELIGNAFQFFLDARVNSLDENLVDSYTCQVYNSQIDTTLSYNRVDQSKLPGGSYSAMCEVANTIYTADIASMAYNYSARISPAGFSEYYFFPLYHIDENGEVYAYGHNEYAMMGVNIPSSKNGEVKLKIVSGDSKTARAIVTVRFGDWDGPRSDQYKYVECKFENTANGWRISESEFSILMATSESGLDDYRDAHPEKVDPEVMKLPAIEVECMLEEMMADYYYSHGYYTRYLEYIAKEQAKGNDVEYTEIVKEITLSDGIRKSMKYVPIISKIGYDKAGGVLPVFMTDAALEGYLSRAYLDNDFDKFITEDGKEYIAVVEGEKDISFIYDPDTVFVEVTESTDKEATARIYCELNKDGETVPIYVECKFEWKYSRWYIAESDFVDMLTSADGFEYTVGEAPLTGDNAFDTIALCLGGMALVMSVLCLVRRRREF